MVFNMRTYPAVRIIILFALFGFLHPIDVCSQVPYHWVQKADYSGGEIYDPFCFSINGVGYVGTGKALTGITYRQEFWAYDPVSDVWTQKGTYPGSGRFGAKAFVIDGIGYAGTGWDPAAKRDFYAYDPNTNIWTQISDFGGSGRYTAVAFSVGSKGYLGMGYAPCKKDLWRKEISGKL